MEIRQYEDNDLIDLPDLMKDLGYPTTLEAMRQRMASITGNPSYGTFVAVEQGQVVGLAGCRDVHNYEEDGLVIQISVLVVRHSAQGWGIGKALIAHVDSWARDRGAKLLYLTSGIKPERQIAHQFYQKLGFDITGYRFVKQL